MSKKEIFPNCPRCGRNGIKKTAKGLIACSHGHSYRAEEGLTMGEKLPWKPGGTHQAPQVTKGIQGSGGAGGLGAPAPMDPSLINFIPLAAEPKEKGILQRYRENQAKLVRLRVELEEYKRTLLQSLDQVEIALAEMDGQIPEPEPTEAPVSTANSPFHDPPPTTLYPEDHSKPFDEDAGTFPSLSAREEFALDQAIGNKKPRKPRN